METNKCVLYMDTASINHRNYSKKTMVTALKGLGHKPLFVYESNTDDIHTNCIENCVGTASNLTILDDEVIANISISKYLPSYEVITKLIEDNSIVFRLGGTGRIVGDGDDVIEYTPTHVLMMDASEDAFFDRANNIKE